jgi:hypothetical protein
VNPYAFGPSIIKSHVNVMSLIPILFWLKMAFTSLQKKFSLKNHLDYSFSWGKNHFKFNNFCFVDPKIVKDKIK